MQTRNRFFDDAAKIAGGALGTLEGLRREVETIVGQQIEKILAKFDLVTRDEFEAVKELAARARSENEEIKEKIEKLEATRVRVRVAKKSPRRKRIREKKV